MIKLLVGLGNLGKRYESTRHNVGFMVVDRMKDDFLPHDKWREQHGGESLVMSIDGRDLRLLKPLTMMNDSGRAVGAVARYYRLAAEEVMVVHDDIDLSFGEVRIKEGGGHGGHNGLRSIDQAIGRNYRRIRCGVARPDIADKESVAGYVLSGFSKREAMHMGEVISDVVENMDALIGDLKSAKDSWGQQKRRKA